MRARLLVLLSMMMTVLLTSAGCQRPAFWSVERTSPDTVRTLADGQVIGGAGRYGSHAWLGLPFAKPPTGERRWRKPEPPEPWSGLRTATRFGAVCPQPGTALGGGRAGELVGEEDCLTLSVWAPPFKPSEVPVAASRLPVMVWIHGGGNSIGTAAFYDGGRLAAEQRVVVVAVQYRLGPLGWFRHAALREGADALDASGNFGTLDLVRALEWVRDNAAAFGGDAGNVTIFGESAGGQNVYTLLLTPRAKGLFHRAIVESGGLWSSSVERAEGFAADSPDGHHHSSNEVVARLLVSKGRARDLAEARRQLEAEAPSSLAAWLRGLTPSELLGAYAGGGRAGMLDAPLVFRDGVVLPKGDWLERFEKPDGWNRVPVLAGSNRDEMRLFLFLEPGRVRRVLGLFPRLDDEPSYSATGDLMSRFWKLNGVDRPLEALLRSGASDVFAYRWDWRDEPVVAGGDLSVMLGAAHGLEVAFVFGHFEMGPLNIIFNEKNTADRDVVSSAMRQYWTQFARAGAPGRGTSGALPEWRRWTAPDETHLVFDVARNGGIRMTGTIERQETVIGDLFAEPRLDERERCRVLHELTSWGRGLTRADYEARPECRAFAFEGFPWR
jgi:para-nitrobenzyl esterase